MDINDEHRLNAYSLHTMNSNDVDDTGHNFESIRNETSAHLLLLNPYPLNTSETLEVYNVTESNVFNLWTRANNSTSLSLNITNDLYANNYNLSTIVAFNNSLEAKDASWWDAWTGKPFPSGYTQLEIVTLAFFLTCIIILVVVGNMLVCIAIATEKSLKPVQNWFIASLAVSDFLIGLVIMPFSLARELMGYWMFGQVWCDIHAALDVLLCTASINSLFLISLDRYWSITQAVKYLKKRTPSRAAFMIAFVWVFSALVSLPPLVGWKKAEQSSEYPQCNVSEDVGYVLYSSIGSFYFPALMMVFVYARIFIAARSRARRHIEKKRLKMPVEIHADTVRDTTTTFCTSFSNPSPPENPKKDQTTSESSIQVNICEMNIQSSECTHTDPEDIEDNENSHLTSVKSPPPPQIIIEPTPESRRQSWNIISTSELISSMNVDERAPSLPNNSNDEENDASSNNQNENLSPPKENPSSKTYFLRLKSVSSKAFRFKKPKINGLSKSNSLSKSVTVDDDSDTADSPTSKEPANYESKAFLSAPKLLRSKFGSTLSIADYEDSDIMEDDKKKVKGRVQYHDPPVVGIHISDAERHKRKIAKARERRATLIVGLIMAAFITAWLPFFMLYVLMALCVSCKEVVPEGVFSVAFWLGYCNSAANPIIYTIFNRDYRKAFRKILFR